MEEKLKWQEWIQGELFKRNFELFPYKEEIMANLDQLDIVFDWDQELENLAVNLFDSKNKFVLWFIDDDNWKEGIPEWFTKIDALKKMVELQQDEEIMKLCKSINHNEMKVLRNLLRYNNYEIYCINNKSIPLLFSRDVLIEYLTRIERWDFGVA